MTQAAVITNTIFIPEQNMQTALMFIKGKSPLICDRIPPDIESGKGPVTAEKGRKKQEAPDPDKLFRAALYVRDEPIVTDVLPDDHPDKYGFPAKGFKKSIVKATTLINNAVKVLPQTLARMIFVVEGDLIPLEFPKDKPPHLRVDTPRNARGQIVTKYRAQFDEWSAMVPVTYNADRITSEMTVNLFSMAGESVGVGCRRPENGDSFGRWTIEKVG